MYSQIDANKRKTALLMFLFLLLISLIAFVAAWLVGSYAIVVYALVFAVGYVLWSYFGSAAAVLSISNAVKIEKKDAPELWRIVENLCITTGIPMPGVYVIDDPAPNAFATGRDPQHASIAVTTGLLQIMNKQELEGVLAHELGHVQNYDIRVSMIAFGLVAAVGLVADTVLRTLFWGRSDDESSPTDNPIVMVATVIALILAPLAATLIQLSISRKREYLADATGALTTRYPEGLASALQKIAQHGSVMTKQSASTAHLFFANPLSQKALSNLFSTHPPIEDRIAALRQMGEKA